MLGMQPLSAEARDILYPAEGVNGPLAELAEAAALHQVNELSSRRRLTTFFVNEQSPFYSVQIDYANVGRGNLTFLNRDLVRLGGIPIVAGFFNLSPNTFRFSMLPLDGVVPSAQEGPIAISARKWNATRSMCGSTYKSEINFDWRSAASFNIRFEYLTSISACGIATIATLPANPELIRVRCLDTVTTAHEIGHILGFDHRNVTGDLIRPAVSADRDVRSYHIRALLEKYF